MQTRREQSAAGGNKIQWIRILWIGITGKRVAKCALMIHPQMFFFPRTSSHQHSHVSTLFLTHTIKTRKTRIKIFYRFSSPLLRQQEKIVKREVFIEKSSSVYMQCFPLWILRTCVVALKILHRQRNLFLGYRAAISGSIKRKMQWRWPRMFLHRFTDFVASFTSTQPQLNLKNAKWAAEKKLSIAISSCGWEKCAAMCRWLVKAVKESIFEGCEWNFILANIKANFSFCLF